MVKNYKKKGTRPKNADVGRFSIVCPVWNAERTIAGAINSILSQSYEDWELLLVDDGSTDKSKEIIGKFKDERIKYFKKEHTGIPDTRNYGSSKATGNYIVVQDSDDYSLPDRLEKIARFLNANPETEVLIHGAYVNAWNEQYGCMSRTYAPPNLDVWNNKTNGWPCYKKSLWEKKPFREETKHAYDLMMHLDFFLSGATYRALDEGLYEYVRYQGSASDRFEKSGQREEGFKKIKEILNDEYNCRIG